MKQTRAKTAWARLAPLAPFASALTFALATSAAGDARAQQTPPDPPAQQLANPASLQLRHANFAWEKDLLRASFSFRDIADRDIGQKLSSGLPSVLVMRAYVFEEGRTEPVALAARTCSVVYDLWDEVYRVKLSDPGGERNVAAINVSGVLRLCTEAQDFPIAVRAVLKAGKPHFLGVIAEVNPISDATLQQIRQWVSRPTGSTGLSTGDALFGSFVGLFVRQIGRADRTVVFRTQTFVP
jgi:hypothetical protein